MDKFKALASSLARDMFALIVNIALLPKIGGKRSENRESVENILKYTNRQNIPMREKLTLKRILFPSKGSLVSGSEIIHSRTDYKSSGHKIVFINGILTDKDNAQVETDVLSMILRESVTCTYNPTRGFCVDLIECILGRTLNARTAIADDVYRHIRDQLLFDDKVKVTVIGHSQGGIILTNVIDKFLKRFGQKRTTELFKRVNFVTFGSGDDGILNPVYDVPNFVQVKNTGDFVANLYLEDPYTRQMKNLVTLDRDGHNLITNYLGHVVKGVKTGKIRNPILQELIK